VLRDGLAIPIIGGLLIIFTIVYLFVETPLQSMITAMLIHYTEFAGWGSFVFVHFAVPKGERIITKEEFRKAAKSKAGAPTKRSNRISNDAKNPSPANALPEENPVDVLPDDVLPVDEAV
jgi:hypothetical protein